MAPVIQAALIGALVTSVASIVTQVALAPGLPDPPQIDPSNAGDMGRAADAEALRRRDARPAFHGSNIVGAAPVRVGAPTIVLGGNI